MAKHSNQVLVANLASWIQELYRIQETLNNSIHILLNKDAALCTQLKSTFSTIITFRLFFIQLYHALP